MSNIKNILRKDIISWSLYDFANTIFSMNILSLYFKRWVVEDLGREGLYYDIAFSTSMLLTGLIMPALGAISDHSHKKRIFLLLFTLLCCVSIGIVPALPLGLFSLVIILFSLSNFFYEGGMVFYNSLLYSVSAGIEARFVSGFGVAVGYLGSIAGMLLVLPFVKGNFFGWDISFLSAGGKASTFMPTAIFFFLFSIPAFIWVKESIKGQKSEKPAIREAYREVWNGIKDTKKYPGVMRFLVADYFFEDAVATVILNIGLYSSLVIGLNDTDLTIFLIISTISAMAGSFAIGHISQNRNLKKIMRSVIYGWIITLFLFVLIDNKILIYILGSMVGILLGGLWTVSRPLLAEMVPKEELGKFFGLYSLSGRAAAVVGPIIWGVIVYLFNPSRFLGGWVSNRLGLSPESAMKLPYWLAVLSLTLMMSVGLIIFRKLPEQNAKG
jgi:UMF1 family MFS transporter